MKQTHNNPKPLKAKHKIDAHPTQEKAVDKEGINRIMIRQEGYAFFPCEEESRREVTKKPR